MIAETTKTFTQFDLLWNPWSVIWFVAGMVVALHIVNMLHRYMRS